MAYACCYTAKMHAYICHVHVLHAFMLYMHRIYLCAHALLLGLDASLQASDDDPSGQDARSRPRRKKQQGGARGRCRLTRRPDPAAGPSVDQHQAVSTEATAGDTVTSARSAGQSAPAEDADVDADALHTAVSEVGAPYPGLQLDQLCLLRMKTGRHSSLSALIRSWEERMISR